jgi:hypothetical protein
MQKTSPAGAGDVWLTPPLARQRAPERVRSGGGLGDAGDEPFGQFKSAFGCGTDKSGLPWQS